MHAKRLLLTVGLLSLAAGCRPSGAQPHVPSRSASSEPDAGRAIPEAALSAETLDRYIQYQKALIPLEQAVVQSLEKAETTQGRAHAQALAELRERSASEEKARRTAGLSLSQVERLDALVAEVVRARKLSNAVGEDEAIRRMSMLITQLPDEQQATLAKTLTQMRERQTDLKQLKEARQRFGDRDVELVLTREEELVRGYAHRMAALMGTDK